MVPAAFPPALALIAGAAAGVSLPVPWRLVLWILPPLAGAAAIAWHRHVPRITTVLIVAAFACAGAVLGAHARETAIDTPLRRLLDREFGGFRLETFDVAGEHGPVATRLRLIEDASPAGTVTTLRAQVLAVRLHDGWIASGGGVVLSVGGAITPARVDRWRRGRTLQAPIAFRRPARYLDEGVADFERQDALDGVTLLGSIKSGLLIDVIGRGNVLTERAADVRAYVRRRIRRWIAPRSTLSAAVVSAVLIGDRGGLPDDVRARLQAAGTYHVIAISGGNIAILAGVIILALAAIGVSGRRASLVTLVLLIGYAQVVTAGPSVWRATLVAVVYLAARLLDHRSAPWQVMALAGGLLAAAQPLDVRNAGFILTFGATGALLMVAGRLSAGTAPRPQAGCVSASLRLCRRFLTTSVAASAAVEIALLPVMAVTFSRVTIAGLILNLAAVPLMAVVQIAGMIAVCADSFETPARLAGWTAHLAAAGIVESARLVDVAPWLTRRVPPPSPLIVIAYYAGLAIILGATKAPKVGRAILPLVVLASPWLIFLTAATAIVAGTSPLPPLSGSREPDRVRLTVFDVGQGDAMVLQVPRDARRNVTAAWWPFADRRTLMVDSGGSPFGNGAFDIGARVVEPALWTIGIRSLDTLLLTHGDPDHIGGAATLIDDFQPPAVWQGIPVPRAAALQDVLARAGDARSDVQEKHAGEEFAFGPARIIVLSPRPADWERQKVRNDDSVVLEVVYRDVALLLTGDIGSGVEGDIVPRLVPAKTRILKVAHHGSRTSTSQAFLDAWRPQIALISCGRGNTFGHPAPEVIERLTRNGAAIYRTDRDGEITVDTDGEHVGVRTFTGGRK